MPRQPASRASFARLSSAGRLTRRCRRRRVAPASRSGVQHGQRVLRRGEAHLHVGIGRHAADVRAECDALFTVERMRRSHRFDSETVESGARNLPRTNGVQQCCLVDQTAATVSLRDVFPDSGRADYTARCARRLPVAIIVSP